MRTVNLHVGHFKTGTSSFQHAMARVRAELRNHGVLYPAGNERHPLQHGGVLRPVVRTGDREPLEATLRRFEASGAQSLVLSAEAVSAGDRAGIHRLVDAVAGVGRVRIVYAVRDWAGYLPSRYAQNCRAGDGWTWWEFLEAVRADFDGNADVNYAINIEAFASAGADEVQLVHYRPDHAIADIVRAMALPSEVEPLLLSGPDERQRNVTSDTDEIEVSRLLNALQAADLGDDRDRMYRAFLRREAQPPRYRWGGVAREVLDSDLGGPLRSALDARREPPPFVDEAERGRWLELLAAAARTHGLAPPPPEWPAGGLPASHRPSLTTTEDLAPDLRAELTRITTTDS